MEYEEGACLTQTGMILHVYDSLPFTHRLSNRALYCKVCDKIVHGATNQPVYPWIEISTNHTHYSADVLCLACYMRRERS